MKLVFIHGRSQEKKDPVQLKADWIQALLKGFASIQAKAPENLEIVFPYYGDLLFEETERVASKEFRELIDKGAADPAASPPAEEQEFVRDLVMQMAAGQDVSREEVEAEAYGQQLVDRGVQNWKVVLAALRLLDKVPGVASTSVELFTRDVWAYLSRKGVRDAVNKLVAAAIPETEPCVVVSHSLGTIVAYNLLMDRKVRANVRKFITLGSPLGIDAIQDRLPSDSPPRVAPEGVGHWFNARDSRDVVALYDISSKKFRGNPAVQNYGKVKNRSENRHGIREYLHNAVVAAEISAGLRL